MLKGRQIELQVHSCQFVPKQWDTDLNTKTKESQATDLCSLLFNQLIGSTSEKHKTVTHTNKHYNLLSKRLNRYNENYKPKFLSQ